MKAKRGNKTITKGKRAVKQEKRKNGSEPIQLRGKTFRLTFMGARDANKVAAIFSKIEENEKAAVKLVANTAKAYYDAGNILAAAIRNWRNAPPTAKAVAEAGGFPERRVTLALKIFKAFENNPGALNGLALRDALKLIAPPPPSGEEGYNRVDLGGDPGQMRLDFGELFDMPAVGNHRLQTYRTVGDLISEIVVVRRTNDGGFVSKRFAHFSDDVPQNPRLRMAYKTMSQATQKAIEDFLVIVEHAERQG